MLCFEFLINKGANKYNMYMSKLRIKIHQKQVLLVLAMLAIALLILVAIDLFRSPLVKPENYFFDKDLIEEDLYQAEELNDLIVQTPAEKERFKEEIPKNIVVPRVDTKLTEVEKLEIAVPTLISPANPGSSVNQGIYHIKAEDNTFIPYKIIAYEGDIVSLKFTAVDKDYDLVFPANNMLLKAKKGETKNLEFAANEIGNFTFYCSTCGGPEAGPKGNFIIVPKE